MVAAKPKERVLQVDQQCQEPLAFGASSLIPTSLACTNPASLDPASLDVTFLGSTLDKGSFGYRLAGLPQERIAEEKDGSNRHGYTSVL